MDAFDRAEWFLPEGALYKKKLRIGRNDAVICEICMGLYLMGTATQPEPALPHGALLVAEQGSPVPMKPLAESLFVSPQIRVADIPAYAAQGIKTIISNRPDGEAPDQPSFAEIKKAAEANGIKAIHIPIRSASAISDADAVAFGNAVKASPGSTLAYCRSGTRSTFLWSLSEAGKRPAQEIAIKATRAGYDIGPIAPRLEK